MTPQTELQITQLLNVFVMAYLKVHFPNDPLKDELIDGLSKTHDNYLNRMKREFPEL